MKVTVSPGIGFPSKFTVAVIVELIVEPAATVDGSARTDRVPEIISIDVCSGGNVPHSAVIVTVPVSVPGMKVTVASPRPSVIASVEDKVPRVGV